MGRIDQIVARVQERRPVQGSEDSIVVQNAAPPDNISLTQISKSFRLVLSAAVLFELPVTEPSKMITARRNFVWTDLNRGSLRSLLSVSFGVLAVLSLVSHERTLHHNPFLITSKHTAHFRKSIAGGIALSLDSLQREPPQSGILPGMSILGVCWDQSRGDWVLFGEAAPNRPGLPLDALILAFHAVRTELDAPGVDIRAASASENEAMQQVSYYGGVESTVVGRWFFDFDYWMKRKSLGEADADFPEIPSYWEQTSLEWAKESPKQQNSSTTERHNRFWLQTDDFTAIQDGDILTFQSTPLKVRQEARSAVSRSSTSTPNNDTLAQAFADRLTTNLPRLSSTVPVAQIEDFALLIAGITWLASRDPHRNLRSWIAAKPVLISTPRAVPTLARHTERTGEIDTPSGLASAKLSLTLSGGVLIRPTLICVRPEDNELLRLETAILRARPLQPVLSWNFTYQSKQP
jgi:hypothetical protein